MDINKFLKEMECDNNDFINSYILEYIRFIDGNNLYNIKKDTGLKTYTCSKDLAKLTTYSTDDNTLGPIMIIKGKLDKEPVYLIVCGGTELVKNQSTGIKTDILSALELNNCYVDNIRDAILDNIPLRSNIMIIGSSLGGMVAQQVVCLKNIKNCYNIMSVITYGSPLICPKLRDCRVRRLCDKNDIITMLSLSSFSFNSKYYDDIEKCTENGGYKNFIIAHKNSYIENDVWNSYDVLGNKYGNSYIVLDMDKIKYIDALNK